jgi:hypothetical protein
MGAGRWRLCVIVGLKRDSRLFDGWRLMAFLGFGPEFCTEDQQFSGFETMNDRD